MVLIFGIEFNEVDSFYIDCMVNGLIWWPVCPIFEEDCITI